ncbi:MAG: hypothetical protein CRN43_20300 [Candidatus Nephrothrix sp. EaCA]|nr:MAG: hypothetical protein CRN43_20300 [Candidatus Nephrothrix sp. EaCA]
MKKILSFTILLVLTTEAGQSKHMSFIVSSSYTGRYTIIIDTKDGKKHLTDLKDATILKKFSGDFEPLTWISDESVIYSRKEGDSTEMGIYYLPTDSFRRLNLVSREWYEAVLAADYVTFPNYVSTLESAFIMYLNDGMLYKYTILSKRNDKVYDLNRLVGNGFVNNITVDSDGKKILLIFKKEHTGYLYAINLAGKKGQLIEKGGSLFDDGSYVYFTKDNNLFIYYRYVAATEGSSVVTVVLYNLKTNTSKVLATLQNIIPLSAIHIPSQKKFFVNILGSIAINIEISKHVLHDFVKALLESLTVKEITY